MRTTLDLDADVLEAARSLAAAEGRSMGKVLSDLARRGLRPRPAPAEVDEEGFPVFPVADDAALITMGMVKNLVDDE